MPLFKTILKNTLWVALILAVGQISIAGKTVGDYFLYGVGRSCVWSGHQVLSTKWLAGMDHPEWLDKLFEVGTKEKKSPVNMEHLTEKEREQVRKILQ
jgi:hypothetical protein